MIIDVPFEITLKNLEDKLNFLRCYSDDLVKRSPTFDWAYWRNYYENKIKDWEVANIPDDEYRWEIADNSQPDYLSHQFLGLIV